MAVVSIRGGQGMQKTFSELEYAGKRKQTRRDRFLADLEAVTPWLSLVEAIAP